MKSALTSPITRGSFSPSFRWETVQMRVRGLQPAFCKQQRSEEAFTRPLKRQAVHVQGQRLWEMLHAPEFTAQTHEAPLQGWHGQTGWGRWVWVSRGGGRASPIIPCGGDTTLAACPLSGLHRDSEVTLSSHFWQQFGLHDTQAAVPFGSSVAAPGQLQRRNGAVHV